MSIFFPIEKILDPDHGMLIFRDYGLYDYSMIRYSNGHKLSENFYVRQDGTRTYYFSIGKSFIQLCFPLT